MKITIAFIVPPVLLLLGKHLIVKNYDLSSLRMLSSGAAPLTKDLVDAVYQRIKVPVKQGYGLSETSPATRVQMWDQWQSTMGSVGTLLPNIVAKYMSSNEKEVPARQTILGHCRVEGALPTSLPYPGRGVVSSTLPG